MITLYIIEVDNTEAHINSVKSGEYYIQLIERLYDQDTVWLK